MVIKKKIRGGWIRKPVSYNERMRMLFWYTVFNGNYSKTALKVSEETGIKRHRKVVLDTAKRHNFATLSHVVRDEVNKQFYGSNTPGMGRIMKLAADLMEIDEDILVQCKRFFMGAGKSKIASVTEALRAIKHVTTDLENISGIKDIKNAAFHDLSEKTKPDIGLTMKQVLADLDPKEKHAILGAVVTQQIDTIVENRTGGRSSRQKNKDDKLATDMLKNIDNFSGK